MAGCLFYLRNVSCRLPHFAATPSQSGLIQSIRSDVLSEIRQGVVDGFLGSATANVGCFWIAFLALALWLHRAGSRSDSVYGVIDWILKDISSQAIVLDKVSQPSVPTSDRIVTGTGSITFL